MKKTKKNYEEYLNDLYSNCIILEECPGIYDYLPKPLLERGKLGTCLRKHDPIQFEVGFDEWHP